MEGSGVSLEPAAVAASSSVKRNLSLQGFTPMATALLYDRFVHACAVTRMLTKAPSTQAIRSSQCCERRAGRTFGWLFVRPA